MTRRQQKTLFLFAAVCAVIFFALAETSGSKAYAENVYDSSGLLISSSTSATSTGTTATSSGTMAASSTNGTTTTTPSTVTVNTTSTVPLPGNAIVPMTLSAPQNTNTIPQQQTTPTNLPVTSQSSPVMQALPATGSTPAPMVVDIGSGGSALVRGVVISTASNMITVRSWGGIWMIRTGGSGMAASGGINVGDFVGAEGTVNDAQIYTIDARFIRNWSTNPYTSAAPSDVTMPDTSIRSLNDTGNATGTQL